MTRQDPDPEPNGSFADQALAIRVDKSSPLPVYAQIADGLRRLLRNGTVPHDSELPSERLLCEAYRVSRMTLRQALGALEREGLVQARRGRGTFVSIPTETSQSPSRLHEDTIPGAAITKLLSFRIGEATTPAREFLGLERGERVYHVRRLRLTRGDPFALEFVQIPQPLCPNLNQLDLVHDSFYRILEERYGLRLADCAEEISAVRPSRDQRQLLECPVSAAILVVCRRMRASTGIPALFAITASRGDLYTAVRSMSCNVSIDRSVGGLFERGKQTSPAVCQHEPASHGS